MPSHLRRATVRALAKINLSLRVLHKRPDGYHELRTLFQTISLADQLEISCRRAPRTSVQVTSSVEIPGENLADRAARMVLEELRVTAQVRIHIDKRIPLGGGLGGGSSDAAAVLLALPPLTGAAIGEARLGELAAQLGSDVPFLLMGGTAAARGRGDQLAPVAGGKAPMKARYVLLGAPPRAVATPQAYRALKRGLTSRDAPFKMKEFQSLVRVLECPEPDDRWQAFCHNDFEAAVFPQHPQVKFLQRRLAELEATLARMSGSGSAVFGVFSSRERMMRARRALLAEWQGLRIERVGFVSRREFRAAYRKALAPHIKERIWPPVSRYAPPTNA